MPGENYFSLSVIEVMRSEEYVFEAGDLDDMFTYVNKANISVQFAVRTPTVLTKTANIRN